MSHKTIFLFYSAAMAFLLCGIVGLGVCAYFRVAFDLPIAIFGPPAILAAIFMGYGIVRDVIKK